MSLKLHKAHDTLTGELRQKPVDASVPLCNIDPATLALRKAGSGSQAIRRREELGQLFQAEQLVEEGLFHANDGQLDTALPPFKEALEIKSRVFGEGHPATLAILTHVAFAYSNLGRLPEALPLLEKAFTLSMRERGERHPETLISLENLARAYRDLGRLPEAVNLFEKVYEHRSVLQGDRDPDTMASLANLAYAYRDTGHLREALPLFEKRLKLHTKERGEHDLKTLVSLNQVAQVHFDLGHVPEALALFERSLELTMKVPRAQFNFDRHLDALRKFPETLPLLEKALKLATAEFGERDPNTLRYRETLAIAYVGHERLQEALPLFEKSLNLYTAKFGQQDSQSFASRQLDHGTLARRRLALAYRDLGRWPEAIPLFERVVKVYSERVSERKWVPTVNSLLESSDNLARAYKAHGRPEDALGLSAKFVEDAEYVRKAPRSITAEQRQGLLTRWVSTYKMFSGLHISHGDTREAFRLAELSKARTLLDSSASRRAYESVAVGLFQSDQQKVKGYQSRLASLNEQIAQAMHMVRETESGNVREYESRMGMRGDQRAQFDQKVRDYEEMRVGGSDHPVVAAARGHRHSTLRLRQEQIEVAKKFDALRRQLANKYPKYAKLSEVSIIGAEEGQRLIPENAVFLSYLLDGDTPLAFMITAQRGLQAKVLDAVPGLGQTVETYRTLLSYPDVSQRLASESESGNRAWRLPNGSFALSRNEPEPGAKKVTDASVIGRHLAAKLLTPVLSNIAEKGHWIISPDGALAMLPFETLPVEAETVLAKHDVSYTQSLSIMALLREREQDYNGLRQRKTLFAMGGALYAPASRDSARENSQNKRASNRSLAQVDALLSGASIDSNAVTRTFDLLEKTWENLPGSEKEVDDVAKLFGPEQATVYKKTEATEAKLQELNARLELSKYRYLLFATHGYLNTESPALSSLVLGQIGKAPGTDGYVTAAEWPSYDLASDLMVVSACDTGVGRVVLGEGILGLPYALYVAGTKNTVLSLWSVSDKSTAEFMRSLFAKIKVGVPQVQALNQTKREFTRHDKFSKPAFWAPFILYGI